MKLNFLFMFNLLPPPREDFRRLFFKRGLDNAVIEDAKERIKFYVPTPDDELVQSGLITQSCLAHLLREFGSGAYSAKIYDAIETIGIRLDNETVDSKPLKSLKILDVFSGSGVTTDDWWDPQKHSPIYSRITAKLGAEVLALDIRPQLPNEIFESLQVDLSDFSVLSRICEERGPFDIIHAKGTVARPGRDQHEDALVLGSIFYRHVKDGGRMILNTFDFRIDPNLRKFFS